MHANTIYTVCYITLYSTILYYIMLCYITLYFIILHCVTLWYILLYNEYILYIFMSDLHRLEILWKELPY